MSAFSQHPVVTSNDKAEILHLIHLRHRVGHDRVHRTPAEAAGLARLRLGRTDEHRGFGSWETPPRVEPEDLIVDMSGDCASSEAVLRISGTKKGMDETVHFRMRETLCFERKAGGWQIVHTHTWAPTSAPA